MVVVGLVRPAFNAANNYAFGAAANGRAAAMISLVFLASLFATAGLPSVMVLQVSRALGREDSARAAAAARFTGGIALVLAVLGIFAALVSANVRSDLSLSTLEQLFVVLGIAGYAYWRFARSLFLARGKALESLRADVLSVMIAAGSMILVVSLGATSWAIAAFIGVYLIYAILTLRPFTPLVSGGSLEAEERRSVLLYCAMWSAGTAASLATNELSVLVLNHRVDKSLVGEFSVALSFLSPLTLAPRIIELPLVHELSVLGGRADRERQRELTSTSLHWLTILILAVAGGAAILSRQILEIAGNVRTAEIATVFTVLAFTFALELSQTPSSNLLAAEAHPVTLAFFGASPLPIAVLVWMIVPTKSALGVAYGLAAAQVYRFVALSAWARLRYGVELFRAPFRKITALALGAAVLWSIASGLLNAYVGAVVFELGVLVVFKAEIITMIRSARPSTRGTTVVRTE
jgi:O-antigen/teichoic acid export membrane protein